MTKVSIVGVRGSGKTVLLAVLGEYAPFLYSAYGHLPLFTLTAVDRTNFDEKQRPIPALSFASQGLETLMSWILEDGGRGATTLPQGSVEEIGRNEDEKQHQVTLTKPFYIGVFEVTQGQWAHVMNSSGFKGGTRPEYNLTWEKATEFCKQLRMRMRHDGFRLPMEAQWEYACRAGTKGPYAGHLHDMAWFYDNTKGSKSPSDFRLHSVGEKNANSWGLYDMHGNVCEWCADGYGSYNGNEVDPQAPKDRDFMVKRGGHWLCPAKTCRSACRCFSVVQSDEDFYGMRICFSQDLQK